MMNWRLIHRRQYLLIAGLLIVFAAGTLSSTAYAMLRGPNVQAKNFSVTYVGVTGPLDSMPPKAELVLTQADGEFVGGRRSQVTVSIWHNPRFGTLLTGNDFCNDASDLKGWCIDEGKQTWSLVPRTSPLGIQTNGTTTYSGDALVKQIIDGEGYEGLVTYRATVRTPESAASEGVIVTVSIEGFVSKVNKPGDDRRGR